MKFVTLFLFLLVSRFSFSQSYTPFPDSNATWVNYEYWFEDGWPAFITSESLIKLDNFCVNGEDTIIGPNTYTKLNYCEGGYKGAFRDSVGYVYLVLKDSINELIWYNFNLSVGDTFVNYLSQWSSFDSVYVSEIDSILITGDYRTIIHFDNIPDVWTEGFGCSAGLFTDLASNNNVSGSYAKMHCFSHNDTSYTPDGYTTSFNAGNTCPLNYLKINKEITQGFLKVFPNPTNGLISITINKFDSQNQLQISNSLGQVINIPIEFSNSNLQIDFTNLPTGIYFVIIEIDGEIYSQKIIRE